MCKVLIALSLLTLGCDTAEPRAPAVTAAAPPRRQLVLVTLDTTRADRLGCYGYAQADTPNLDALAARGSRFDQAFTSVPLTIPSHATLFTGLLPPHHGVRTNGDQRLSTDALTLAELLQRAGWRTHAAVGAFVTQAHWGFGQGFDVYDDSLGVPTDRLSWRAERPASQVVDDALAALDSGADFLWVHMFDPHAPYEPPEPQRSRHQGRPYDGEIAAMDAEIGRLLARVPGGALIVVVGDHGEGLGDGGEQQHGLLLQDATLRVPLLVAGPGVPVGVIHRTVSLADVTPTLLRMLDVPLPAELDGTDLFEPAWRSGVYAETRYGQEHYGWAPMSAMIGDEGRIVRAVRDEAEGEVSQDMLQGLDALERARPRWEAQPVTLDLSQVEQLQALGYLSGPAPTTTSTQPVDPRDGIQDVQRLGELHALSAVKQEAGLRELLAEQPGFRDARFRLGLLLARSGRLAQALTEITTLQTQAPDSTTAATLAELWTQAGDPDEALFWFREALQMDPRSQAARAGEVESLAALGRTEEARALADLLLDEAPDQGRLLVTRALLGLAAGEPPEPWLEPVGQLARERPYEARLLQAAARLHAEAGLVEEAYELYRQELRWRPFNLAARVELFALYEEHGRLVDAVKTLRPLLAVQPDEPRWHQLAARCYQAMGREDLARQHLDRGSP